MPATVLAVVLAVAGCGSPKPDLYSIATVPGTPQGGGPAVVLMREIGLARYLDRQGIVRSAENYRFVIEANDWWGETLSAMLNRVLVEELNQRLPGSMVYGENGAVTPLPGATVELNIQKLDQDPGGALVLLAQAAILLDHQPDRTRSFRISVPMQGTDTGAEVAAISAAVGQLADGLAAMLRGG
jgi:uncharacterized lipoprotein YmbA